MRKKKQQQSKDGQKDGEYLITYTRHLEKRLRNIETEKHLLEAEVLRLKRELLSLGKEDGGNKHVEGKDIQNANSKISNAHEGIKDNEMNAKEMIKTLKWYELHSGKADRATVTSRQFGAQENNESERIFKIFVLGIPEKTAFIRKYVTGVFTEDIKMTTGADFSVKKVKVEGAPIILRIWDFASEDSFNGLLPAYIKGTNGVIIMNDVLDANGFKRLSEYIEIVRNNVGNIPVFLAIPGLSSNVEKCKDLKDIYTLNEITPEVGLNGKYVFEVLTKKILEHESI
ncbi:MAG: hypothetical protein ACW98D_00485 [Promethearchaeota archaeon]